MPFSNFSTVANIEETLRNILIQDINSKHPAFGQTIKIDTSNIIIKRDLEHTYQSESFVREALNESMSTNYPKSPQTPGKDKILQSRVGVVRKTTVKPNKHDPDEPEIDTENIPVVQGSFQITKTEADITENKQSSSPVRHDDKPGHKISNVPKSTTTTKAPVTRITTTTKRVPTSTPKSRPFTIKSTLNVKSRTEPTPKKDLTTARPVSSTTPPTTVVSSSTIIATTTSNVSQILFDLLTNNENHYKDVPKIDSLFTVPHVIDNEPWRPITQPYYETSNKPTPSPQPEERYPAPIESELNAEDRMGVAEVEVVDDVAILESMLTPIPPAVKREKTTRRPIGLHKDPYHGLNGYEPNPVYTSFTLPTYAPPLRNMETLGSSYPKPFPIPVDKISSFVEGIAIPDDEDDGKPVPRPPPKDKKTSVVLNVELDDDQNDDTEKVLLDGASIIKKHETTVNKTISTVSTTTISETTTTTPATITTISSTEQTSSMPSSSSTTSKTETEPTHSSVKDKISVSNTTTSKENSTRRPNNKVSIIPTSESPHHVWELVNTSTNDKNETVSKTSPEKFYNDTLQAIITKNDAVFPNTTPKFPSKVSIMRDLTEIIKKYSQKSTIKPDTNEEEKVLNEEVEVNEERRGHTKMTGTVEVVLDDEIETTTAGAIITLLPAKSNLGGNRPLRRRPAFNSQPKPQEKENLRSFFNSEAEAQKIIADLNTEKYPSKDDTDNITEGSEIVTSIFRDNEAPDDQVAFDTDNRRALDMPNVPSGNRYPKSNDDNKKQTIVPEGTYRVSYHVTGSVSTKQANKTQNLPAYELALEPDIVLEIPSNQNNSLSIDKLRQLANLATISDSNNNTLFRAPGGVISTKAIPSSYTLNQAGFKILTKTFNNNKGQSNKQDENSNSLDKPEKTYSKPYKPQKEKDIAIFKEVVKEGK